jgi:iron complex transport system ATP-binding protein
MNGAPAAVAAMRRDTTGALRLRARNVRVRFGAVTIVDGVDLDVHAGEVVALVGPNGAGKSTLLGALAGDLAHTGSVTVDGNEVASLRPVALARHRAVLPQHTKTLFSFTAADVVRMGRYPCDDGRDDTDVVAESLDRVGATPFASRAFPSLSGGEQTLVSLARVLAQSTPVVLLDEPTAALDLAHQEAVCQVARTVAEEGRAVVVVLHELNLAARYADRVAVLEAGRLVRDADPNTALEEAMLSRVYGHRIAVIDHPLLPGRRLVLPHPYAATKNVPDATPTQQRITP